MAMFKPVGYTLSEIHNAMRTGFFRFALFILFALSFSTAQAQSCFYIESILVDACGDPEGLNEMVGVRTRTNPLNVNTLQITWATAGNPWNGVVMNATTAALVAQLNQQVQEAGGCGQIIEPLNGIVPANSKLIIVTSYLMNPAFNSFGALAEDIYIVFNNSTTQTGHFANTGTGNRTLTISGSGCTRSLTYNRALLVGLDGATVYNLNDAGLSYANTGCMAPVEALVFEAGEDAELCGSTSYNLQAAIQAVTDLQWTASTGTFSDATIANPTLTWAADFTGTIQVSLQGLNPCGEILEDRLEIVVRNNQPALIPDDFSICTGETVAALPTTLADGTVGTWSPAVISTTQSGSYTFTPTDPNSCVVPATLYVTVNSPADPTFDFSQFQTYCLGMPAMDLPTLSSNGIEGTWSPAAITTAEAGTTTYTFTPLQAACSTVYELTISVSIGSDPVFNLPASQCATAPMPTLPTESANGIPGTWTEVERTETYVRFIFEATANTCINTYEYTLQLTAPSVPDFPPVYAICTLETSFQLPTVSPNGISGTWSPAINTNQTATYTFTPTAGQCATSVTVEVQVEPLVQLQLFADANWCEIAANAPIALPTVDVSGVTGSWDNPVVNGTGTYTFTPDAGFCAQPITYTVIDTGWQTPNFPTTRTLCTTPANYTALPTTSPNGIAGTWSPSVYDPAITTYTFTPLNNPCAVAVTQEVIWESPIVPDFPVVSRSFCYNAAVDTVLPTTSPNGITGTWSPAQISTTQSGTYLFTPAAGQCAATFTLTVTVKPIVDLGLPTALTYCEGDAVMALPTVSPSGHTGTWSPAQISATQSGTYTFTPNGNATEECVYPHTLTVTINPVREPNFVDLTYCFNQLPGTLATTSPNGISGTWSPAVIQPNVNRSYVFTPTAGQCASPQTIQVTFTTAHAPDFAAVVEICRGSVFLLPDTAPNGVVGTWFPAQVDTQQNGEYTFTYGQGDCQYTFVMQVRIQNVPEIDLGTHRLCINPDTQVAQASVTLQTNLSPTVYTHTWFRDGQQLTATGNSLMVVEPGLYRVEYTHTTTGCSAVAQTLVTASTPMTVRADAGPIMELVQTITVHVQGGSGNFMYQLDNDPWQDSPIFGNVREIGMHTISVRDLDGCADVTVPVQVLTYPPFFTPNNDGFNDYWTIQDLPYPLRSTIYIYDRYGKLLVVLDPNGVGWDGNFHGRPMPASDYWFKLEYIDYNEQPQTFRAHFSLKR